MPSFYNPSNFINTVYAANIRLKEHFADIFFQGDQGRIVYSTTQYALRKRSQTQKYNNLNLPFMNFLQTNYENGGPRSWFNHYLNVEGMFIPELGYKLRVQPIHLTYDSTVFIHQHDDLMYAYSEVLWDEGNETTFAYLLEVDGQQMWSIGVLTYNLSFNDQYTEQDWLDQNKIFTIGMNFSVQTFLVRSNVNVVVPETVVFRYATENQLGNIQNESTYTAAIDHVSESVGNFSKQ